MFYNYQGKHHQYHILQEKQITMNKEIFLKAMAIYAILASFGWIFYSAKSAQLTEENRYYIQQYIHAYNAMETVAEYCDSTADTGEMDDFIQSDNGQLFWKEFKIVDENQ